ncbi:MAG: MSHA biogenesis protein MshE, partial [Gammaproteobacteria bacterium]|nr:MSHA biogenesis protein MshE [Gammaproteobacteria bacterium]
TGKKLGRVLAEIGAVGEKELHEFLAKHLGVEYLDLSGVNLDSDTVTQLAEVQARRLRALVLQSDEDGLLVGMADPNDIIAYDELCRLLKK